jgi:hypothetical protein
MQQPKTRTVVYLLSLVIAIPLLSSMSANARGTLTTQATTSPEGRWIWKQAARKNKPQAQFTITIKRQGNHPGSRPGDIVSGVYSVDEFINGKWQGEDGNQTPFRGEVNGNTVRIEFDPSATVPGYQENVIYAAPTDGRKPSISVLTLSGKTLLWRMVSGPKVEGVPARFTLRRDRKRAASRRA